MASTLDPAVCRTLEAPVRELARNAEIAWVWWTEMVKGLEVREGGDFDFTVDTRDCENLTLYLERVHRFAEQLTSLVTALEPRRGADG